MADKITVQFEFENESGGVDVKPITVKRMKFEAFHEVLSIVNDVYGLLQKDQALNDLFAELFMTEDEPVDPEIMANFTEDEKAEMKKQRQAEAERRFIKGLLGAFPLLTLHLPKQATALLVAMTGVDEKELAKQDAFVVMDLYDACLEVNKIEALVDRIKKSLDVTKSAMTFLKKRREATAK